MGLMRTQSLDGAWKLRRLLLLTTLRASAAGRKRSFELLENDEITASDVNPRKIGTTRPPPRSGRPAWLRISLNEPLTCQGGSTVLLNFSNKESVTMSVGSRI